MSPNSSCYRIPRFGSRAPAAVLQLLLLTALCLTTCVGRCETNWDTGNVAVEKRLLDDVRYLSSDAMEGRGLTTQGIIRASEHIAKQFGESGLNTKAVAGKPFHIFSSRTWKALGDDNRLELHRPGMDSLVWELAKDYTPVSLGKAGEFDLPVVIAGYGITDEKSGYDDFGGIDVSGKAVVILRREPRQADPDSPFNGAKNSEHAYLVRKIQNAASHGAAMVLLCNDHYSISEEKKPNTLMPFLVKSSLATRPVPVVHVMRESLAVLLGETGLVDLEQQIDADLKPKSRLLEGWRISGRVSIISKGDGLRNVIGALEPSEPATETIIVGAHYDHLGRGGSGSLAPWTKEIHNGADDNASGTTVLMEVARQVAARRGELKRRVLFIAFSAEERGLIGSSRYVRSPLYPMADTAAMVNLDMVGRLGERLTVYGTATGNGFEEMADRLGAKQKLKLTKIPGGSGPSDHASFHAAGVPVFHLFTGLHVDYHRPSDDFEKLNVGGMRRITRMTVDIVMELASSTTPTRVAKRTKKTKRVKTTSRPPLPVGTTTLGLSVVDVGDGTGCLVTAVQPRGPAQLGGVRKGDIVLSIDSMKIVGTSDIKSILSKHVAKDTITLVIRRGEISLRIDVELGVVK